MCLILLKPSEIKLPKMFFKNIYQRNKDGFGWMYLNDDKAIQTGKMVTKDWEEHYEAYKPLEDKMVCFHWRMKTQGDVTVDNAHPFVVKENELVLMHNGSLSGYNHTNPQSDTNQFVNQTLQPLLKHIKDIGEFLDDEASEKVFEQMIGKSNKLMLLNNKKFYPINEFYITNDSYIPEMQGLIFSNTYAWDNQFWYKTASQNEINYEYIKKSVTTSIPQVLTYDHYKKQYIPNTNHNKSYQKHRPRDFQKKVDTSDQQTPRPRIESKTLTLVKNKKTPETIEQPSCALVVPNQSLMLQ